jgi:hypothetical protein
MPWTSPKAVEGAKEKPIFVRVDVRSPCWRTDDGDFIGGKDALTECVFTIALAERTTVLNGHTDKEPKGVAAKNRSKFIRLRPYSVFVIA